METNRSKGYAIMDTATVKQVLARAKSLGLIAENYPMDCAIMDLESCMVNGVDTLDLAKLLAAPQFDFVHDICGIARNMQRSNWPGKLGNCFLPRCSAPSKVKP